MPRKILNYDFRVELWVPLSRFSVSAVRYFLTHAAKLKISYSWTPIYCGTSRAGCGKVSAVSRRGVSAGKNCGETVTKREVRCGVPRGI